MLLYWFEFYTKSWVKRVNMGNVQPINSKTFLIDYQLFVKKKGKATLCPALPFIKKYGIWTLILYAAAVVVIYRPR